MSLPFCSGAPGHMSQDCLSLLTTSVHPRGHARASSACVVSVQHHSIVVIDMWLLDHVLINLINGLPASRISAAALSSLHGFAGLWSRGRASPPAQFAPTLRLSCLPQQGTVGLVG